ncbi:metalloregulator ArsR/SmtB family transcription factor [Devosia sp.]|uniref:ArsR/SmtB family transcription factor n=1 Tax=Devosia sp. TaxID=1871048 RepID=UPI003A92A79A
MSPDALFSALGDPTRCRVVELLATNPRPVHELAAEFAISRPAISRHLRVLKEAGLVVEQKKGRENVYALQRAHMKPALVWLEGQGARPAPAKAKVEAKPRPAAQAEPESAAEAPAKSPSKAAAKPKDRPAPKRARKPAAEKPAAPPPPAAAPQLSFFDL